MTTIKNPSISLIIVGQFGAAVAMGLGGYLVSSPIGLALGLGGMICWISNAVFTLRAFRYRGASASRKIVKEFALGEALKILLSGAGFALAFIYVPAAPPLWVFLGYVGVYLVGLAMTLSVVSKYSQSTGM